MCYILENGGHVMALVDYICKCCGKDFFEIVKNVDERVTCPNCKDENVERVYKGKYYGKGVNCSGGCGGCGGC